MSKNFFSTGRSEALNGIWFRVDDAIDYIKSLPKWRYDRDYANFNETEFRRGWADAAQGIGDALEGLKEYGGKATVNGCDFGD